MYRGAPAEISFLKSLLVSFIFCNGFIFTKSVLCKAITRRIFKKDDINFLKAQNCFFKILFYGFISVYGYFVLTNENWAGDVGQYHKSFGPGTYPGRIFYYYIIEFSFYLTELQYLITEYHRKDRMELISHHFVTLSLIVLSYFDDFARIGVVVMGLHDVSDPLLECCKLFIYMGKKTYANIGFIIFTTVFIISRLIFYPYWILYPAFQYLLRHSTTAAKVCSFCLLVLYFLHIYWTLMIYKTFKKIFIKHEYVDARSESVLSARKTN